MRKNTSLREFSGGCKNLPLNPATGKTGRPPKYRAGEGLPGQQGGDRLCGGKKGVDNVHILPGPIMFSIMSHKQHFQLRSTA